MIDTVKDQISNLKYLPEAWDGMWAKRITSRSISMAQQALQLVITSDELAPQIVPLPDGGVQLEWHVAGNDLEIEVDCSGDCFVLFIDSGNIPLAAGEFELHDKDAVGKIREIIQRLSVIARPHTKPAYVTGGN